MGGAEMCPPQKMCWSVTPLPVKVRVCRRSQVGVRSYWHRVGSHTETRVLKAEETQGDATWHNGAPYIASSPGKGSTLGATGNEAPANTRCQTLSPALWGEDISPVSATWTVAFCFVPQPLEAHTGTEGTPEIRGRSFYPHGLYSLTRMLPSWPWKPLFPVVGRRDGRGPSRLFGDMVF